MTRLVLCRHAEAGNAEQVAATADELCGLTLAAVYTSPLTRALETARAVAARHDLAALEMDELREIDFGQVDGLAFDELPAELREGLLHSPAKVRFPGGETYAELQQRVCGTLDRLVAAHPGDTIAVVSHAGSIRAALARWLMMDDEAIFRIQQDHGAVNVVDWTGGVPLVRLVNSTTPSGVASRAALRAAL
jgi:broad specificity phosphatase PhoE